MLGIDEENRTRIALVLALIGVILIVGGLAIAVMNGGHHQIVGPPAPTLPPRTLAHKLTEILFLLVVLVGILMVSTFALVRWTRRYRKWLLHRPQPPTPSSDVWAMHKLPSEEEPPPAEPGEESPPGSGD